MRTAIQFGNAIIDADHCQISGLISEAVDLWMSKVPAIDFDAKLTQIHEALLDHFQTEETVLRASHYDGAARHHLTHEGILLQIDEIMENLHAEEGNSSRFKVIDRLEAILFDHEMVEDGDYVSHLIADGGKLFIDWSSKFNSGISSIDELHRNFVIIYNKLADCINLNKDKEDALDAMVELYDFAVINFPKEEEIIAQACNNKVLFHHQYHKEFLNRLDDILMRYVADSIDVKSAIGGYLRYLLLDHLETGSAEIITTA
jgi:hemerythrin